MSGNAASDEVEQRVKANKARAELEEDRTSRNAAIAPERFADLIDALCTVYTSEGIGVWLTGRHRLLGNHRPIDVIRDGEIERVEQIVEQLQAGAFS